MHVPEMVRAHLTKQASPWCVEGGTFSLKELNFYQPHIFFRMPNILELCLKIPYPLASSLPMLTKKTIVPKIKFTFSNSYRCVFL